MKFSRDLSKIIPNSPLFVNKAALDIIEHVSRETFSVQSKPLRAPCASGDGLLHAARKDVYKRQRYPASSALRLALRIRFLIVALFPWRFAFAFSLLKCSSSIVYKSGLHGKGLLKRACNMVTEVGQDAFFPRCPFHKAVLLEFLQSGKRA